MTLRSKAQLLVAELHHGHPVVEDVLGGVPRRAGLASMSR